jgi:hypothetical protein
LRAKIAWTLHESMINAFQAGLQAARFERPEHRHQKKQWRRIIGIRPGREDAATQPAAAIKKEGTMKLEIFEKKEKTLHEVRAEFIAKAASLNDAEQDEIIKSLIMVYKPQYSLHHKPIRTKKRMTQQRIQEMLSQIPAA